MNWTGGEYSKAARGKHKALQQQQKVHFARARAATLSASTAAAQKQLLSSAQHVSIVGQTAPRYAWHTGHALDRAGQSGLEHKHDEQELRLLEKRQELLQHSDWLGLRVRRPVSITFQGEAEKETIGRRHKISKPHVNLHKRQLQETVAHRINPDSHYDPVVADESSMQIKVGKEVSRQHSQTALLPPINNPDRNSLASSDLEALSEEPMLLDSDDEFFEVQPPKTRRGTDPLAHSPGQTKKQDTSHTYHENTNLSANTAVTGSASMISIDPRSTPWMGLQAPDCMPPEEGESIHSPESTSSERQRLYGRCWQNVLGVPTTSQALGSNVALKSFIETESDDTVRSRFMPRRYGLSDARSLGLIAVVQDSPSLSMKVGSGSPGMKACESLHSAARHSAALHPTHDLARRKSRIKGPQQDCDSSDAIWRQFIIGDDDASST